MKIKSTKKETKIMDVTMKFVETVERYYGPLRQFLTYIAIVGQTGAEGIALDEARKITQADYARFCKFLTDQMDQFTPLIVKHEIDGVVRYRLAEGLDPEIITAHARQMIAALKDLSGVT